MILLKSLLEQNGDLGKACLTLQNALIDSWYGDYLEYSGKNMDGYIKLFITDPLNDNQDVIPYFIEIYQDVCRVPHYYSNGISGVINQGGVLQDMELNKLHLIVRTILRTFAFQTDGSLENLSDFDRLTEYSQTWHNTTNNKFYRAEKISRSNLKIGDFMYSRLKNAFSYGKVLNIDNFALHYSVESFGISGGLRTYHVNNDKFRSYYLLEEV